ncbi:MAG: glycosyltransferase involved in cell wall biosynthesis [Cyclobacteriaceae bacterium]|jgi:glycosyltransferase involved in cell wall biosynthesis
MALFMTPLFFTHRKKLVVTLHGLDVVFPFFWYQTWIKSVLSKACSIITVSDGTHRELLKRGVSGPSVHMIKNGFTGKQLKSTISKDLPKTMHGVGARYIATMGRMVERKGFSWFIEDVLPKLPRDISLVIIGPVFQNERLLKFVRFFLPRALGNLLIKLLGLPMDQLKVTRLAKESENRNVVVLSGLSDQEVHTVLNQSAVFVMPNISVKGDFEGFGLVAVEAVGQGKLCIAADVDGIPSAIENNRTGILLPPGDDEKWSEKLNHYLSQPSLTEELAEQYHENLSASDMSWEKMVDSYVNVFETEYIGL